MRYMQKENTASGEKKTAGIWEYDSHNGEIISSIAPRYRQNEIKVFKADVDPFSGAVSKGELIRTELNEMPKFEYQLTFRQSLVRLCELNDYDSDFLAEQLNVGKAVARHWFRDTMPMFFEFARICKFFKVSMDAFLRRRPDKCKMASFDSAFICDMLREADRATKNFNHVTKETRAQFRHGRKCRLRHVWRACDEYELSLDCLWGSALDGLAQEKEEGN